MKFKRLWAILINFLTAFIFYLLFNNDDGFFNGTFMHVATILSFVSLTLLIITLFYEPIWEFIHEWRKTHIRHKHEINKIKKELSDDIEKGDEKPEVENMDVIEVIEESDVIDVNEKLPQIKDAE